MIAKVNNFIDLKTMDTIKILLMQKSIIYAGTAKQKRYVLFWEEGRSKKEEKHPRTFPENSRRDSNDIIKFFRTSLAQQIIPTALLKYYMNPQYARPRVLLQTLNLNFLMPSLVNSFNSGLGCSGDYLVSAERKERPEHMTLSTR